MGRLLRAHGRWFQVDATASSSEPPAVRHTAPMNSPEGSREDTDPVSSADPTGAGRKAAMASKYAADLLREQLVAICKHHASFHGSCVSVLDCKGELELLEPWAA